MSIPSLLEPYLRDLAGAPSDSFQRLSSTVLENRSTHQKYFYKISPSQPEQLIAESRALELFNDKIEGFAPKLWGLDQKSGVMISSYLDLTSLTREGQRDLAASLANLHEPTAGVEQYGFDVPTFCGATKQDNTWTIGWKEFFTERRLGDMVRRINDKKSGGDEELSNLWEKMKERVIPKLLNNFEPAPRPVLLHGDLWSGNAGLDRSTGKAAIFDPAAYYGHGEADLGIMHMFGGFSYEFFDTYHSIHARSQPYYEKRQKLYELYHHLNHHLMFGGYRSGAIAIMRSLVEWSDIVS